MEHHKLDAIDMRILAELQDNGRITNVELSRRAKITAPPCLRRMRALEKAGFIKGYHADLDGKALGYEGAAFPLGWAACPARARSGEGGVHQGLSRRSRRQGARLRSGGLRVRRAREPGRGRSQALRGAGARLAECAG